MSSGGGIGVGWDGNVAGPEAMQARAMVAAAAREAEETAARREAAQEVWAEAHVAGVCAIFTFLSFRSFLSLSLSLSLSLPFRIVCSLLFLAFASTTHSWPLCRNDRLAAIDAAPVASSAAKTATSIAHYVKKTQATKTQNYLITMLHNISSPLR